ncbi:MAG: YerC/YecD family TrpR-related protein [Oscillospiraceae bacterium]|nr:YerC/YecD family TrpR-related protein [Oscillospiraceae bacterium]MDD6035738.1 YerC/YecD family TrpR-related protein [Lachnospiraceae bacterium]
MRTHLDPAGMDDLCEALLSLKTKEETSNFLRDLCTIQELKALSQRYQVAKLLHTSCRYAEIVEKTGASTATISRVNRSLAMDGTGGYETVFNRLDIGTAEQTND